MLEIRKRGIAIIVVFLAFVVVATAALVFFSISYEQEKLVNDEILTAPEVIQTDAFELVRSLGVGWNLGNALDSIDNQRMGFTNRLPDNVTPEEHYETLWGNPVTTPEMIESIANMGFGSVRVPVTWADNLDENFNIRKDWLLRVEQVVNYVLDNDMYCIINLHHDSGSGSWPWLRADSENIGWMKAHLAIVWAQIAEHFRDYDHRLLFEGFNEILDADSNWTNANKSSHDAVNSLNQVFVDTVRATGGNNADRFLVVKTYGARRYAPVLEDFVLPYDSVEHRLIVGVHFYGTHGFTRQQEEVPWTIAYSNWDYRRNGGLTVMVMDLLREHFVDRGIPVVITEFGAQNKNNTADRVRYAVHYVETASQFGIACFWWDNGGRFENVEDVRNYALFDRHNNRWLFPEIAEAIVSVVRQ